MKMTMDRNNPHINQRYIRVDPGIKIGIDKILHPEIGPLVEEEIKRIITIETIIGQIIEIESRGRWNNHRSGDRSNNYQNYNR